MNYLLSLQESTKIFNLFNLYGINDKKVLIINIFQQLIKDKNINKLNRKYDDLYKILLDDI